MTASSLLKTSGVPVNGSAAEGRGRRLFHSQEVVHETGKALVNRIHNLNRKTARASEL